MNSTRRVIFKLLYVAPFLTNYMARPGLREEWLVCQPGAKERGGNAKPPLRFAPERRVKGLRDRFLKGGYTAVARRRRTAAMPTSATPRSAAVPGSGAV